MGQIIAQSERTTILDDDAIKPGKDSVGLGLQHLQAQLVQQLPG